VHERVAGENDVEQESETSTAPGCGLSTRESELLGHLVTGADAPELARRMFLSEHTVQDHLKSIFAKTAARNRRTLLSGALGT
jgi:DNA-binding CsgD family transcriptional regulator